MRHAVRLLPVCIRSGLSGFRTLALYHFVSHVTEARPRGAKVLRDVSDSGRVELGSMGHARRTGDRADSRARNRRAAVRGVSAAERFLTHRDTYRSDS